MNNSNNSYAFYPIAPSHCIETEVYPVDKLHKIFQPNKSYFDERVVLVRGINSNIPILITCQHAWRNSFFIF